MTEENHTTYERPIITIDVVIVTLIGGAPNVFLQQRSKPPFGGRWALPGGWVHINEDASAEAAAMRILDEKVGIQALYVEQLGVFSGPDRDPRGWSASVTFVAVVPPTFIDQIAGRNGRFFPMAGDGRAEGLAFDHEAIITDALARIQAKSSYSILPAAFIGEEFTLPELQQAYEQLLGRELNDSAFRRKILGLSLIEECGVRATTKRSAKVYRLIDGIQTFERALVG